MKNWPLIAFKKNLRAGIIVALIVLAVWLLLRRPWKRRPLPREIALGLFVPFMATLLYLALDGDWADPVSMLRSAWTRLQTGDKLRLTPFSTIAKQLGTLHKFNSVTQLLGNTLLFMPWGFCLPLLWERFRRPLRMVGMALLLTCAIECTQLFIDRYFEVDDILLNFAGSMLGAGSWRVLHRRWPEMDAHFLTT